MKIGIGSLEVDEKQLATRIEELVNKHMVKNSANRSDFEESKQAGEGQLQAVIDSSFLDNDQSYRFDKVVKRFDIKQLQQRKTTKRTTLNQAKSKRQNQFDNSKNLSISQLN